MTEVTPEEKPINPTTIEEVEDLFNDAIRMELDKIEVQKRNMFRAENKLWVWDEFHRHECPQTVVVEDVDAFLDDLEQELENVKKLLENFTFEDACAEEYVDPFKEYNDNTYLKRTVSVLALMRAATKDKIILAYGANLLRLSKLVKQSIKEIESADGDSEKD